MRDTVDVGTYFLISQMKLISAYFSGGDFLKAVDDLLAFCTVVLTLIKGMIVKFS